MRYVETAEMGGNMNPAGADVAITDTISPTLATQLALTAPRPVRRRQQPLLWESWLLREQPPPS